MLWYLLIAVAGYVASVFTWPWLRTQVIGAENEVLALRARAASLAIKLRG